MRLNVRRGLFRLWIIFACLCVIAVGLVSYSDIYDEFKKASTRNDEWSAYLMLPVDCSEARGTLSSTYSKEKDGLCWYDMRQFRAQYPEYKDLKNDELHDRLYAKAGITITPPHPWKKVMYAAEVALGVPIAVLFLGWSLIWAFSGFRPVSSARR